jgi:hypothetical protein
LIRRVRGTHFFVRLDQRGKQTFPGIQILRLRVHRALIDGRGFHRIPVAQIQPGKLELQRNADL